MSLSRSVSHDIDEVKKACDPSLLYHIYHIASMRPDSKDPLYTFLRANRFQVAKLSSTKKPRTSRPHAKLQITLTTRPYCCSRELYHVRYGRITSLSFLEEGPCRSSNLPLSHGELPKAAVRRNRSTASVKLGNAEDFLQPPWGTSLHAGPLYRA